VVFNCCQAWSALPVAAIARRAKTPMTESRSRDLRRRSRSARRNTSSGLSPISRAITKCRSCPSPRSRKSAANTPSPFPVPGDNAGGKEFPISVPGIALNEQWDQWAVRMSRCKETNLFVDRIALHGGRRGNQDQRSRVVECSDHLVCQRATRIEIVPVTKDRAQLFGERSHGRFAADQILVDPKTLEPSAQPLGAPVSRWL